MHFQHFHCISSDCILHLLHGTAYDCIFTHSCMLHSEVDAFAYLHTHFHCCIWYKVHSCAFKCIQIWMHFHSMLHSRAFIAQDAFTCILCMLHSIHAASVGAGAPSGYRPQTTSLNRSPMTLAALRLSSGTPTSARSSSIQMACFPSSTVVSHKEERKRKKASKRRKFPKESHPQNTSQ